MSHERRIFWMAVAAEASRNRLQRWSSCGVTTTRRKYSGRSRS